jgi:G3E family GTPase
MCEQLQVYRATQMGYDGIAAIEQVKVACQTFSGDTKIAEVILRLASTENLLLNLIYRELSGARDGSADVTHGHSNCNGHSHAHTHSHHECHCQAHVLPSPEQVQMLELAMQSLSPEQHQEMTRIQQLMLSGQRPSDHDLRLMQSIQQQIQAYVLMMSQLQAQMGMSTKLDSK